MAYIEVEGVSKSYKSQKVIHNVNVSFEQGKSMGSWDITVRERVCF